MVPLWFSDHDGLKVAVILDVPVFGPGYWKLNIEILEEEGFRELFLRAFEGWRSLRSMVTSPTEWWEGVKFKIRRLVQAYCGRRKARRAREVVQLTRQLKALYSRFNRGEVFDEGEALRLKRQLRVLHEMKAQELLFRVRGEECEKGERCTAYFFGAARTGKSSGSLPGSGGRTEA